MRTSCSPFLKRNLMAPLQRPSTYRSRSKRRRRHENQQTMSTTATDGFAWHSLGPAQGLFGYAALNRDGKSRRNWSITVCFSGGALPEPGFLAPFQHNQGACR